MKIICNSAIAWAYKLSAQLGILFHKSGRSNTGARYHTNSIPDSSCVSHWILCQIVLLYTVHLRRIVLDEKTKYSVQPCASILFFGSFLYTAQSQFYTRCLQASVIVDQVCVREGWVHLRVWIVSYGDYIQIKRSAESWVLNLWNMPYIVRPAAMSLVLITQAAIVFAAVHF